MFPRGSPGHLGLEVHLLSCGTIFFHRVHSAWAHSGTTFVDVVDRKITRKIDALFQNPFSSSAHGLQLLSDGPLCSAPLFPASDWSFGHKFNDGCCANARHLSGGIVMAHCDMSVPKQNRRRKVTSHRKHQRNDNKIVIAILTKQVRTSLVYSEGVLVLPCSITDTIHHLCRWNVTRTRRSSIDARATPKSPLCH